VPAIPTVNVLQAFENRANEPSDDYPVCPDYKLAVKRSVQNEQKIGHVPMTVTADVNAVIGEQHVYNKKALLIRLHKLFKTSTAPAKHATAHHMMQKQRTVPVSLTLC
jgi:hypothetical protein